MAPYPSEWAIPGLGRLYPSIDSVQIYSSATVGSVNHNYGALLKSLSHTFFVTTNNTNHPGNCSKLTVVGTNDSELWDALRAHDALLGRYTVGSVELAYDIEASSEDDARSKVRDIVALIQKPRHVRRHVISVESEQPPAPGQINGPTFYYEDRRSGVRLKCYARHRKLAGGRFGAPCARIEWTLQRKAAVDRYLGSNKLDALTRVDLNKFVQSHLVLQKVDYGRFFAVWSGKHLSQKLPQPRELDELTGTLTERLTNADFRLKGKLNQLFRKLAYDHSNGEEDFMSTWHLWRSSPAQLRGYLMNKASKRLPRKKGRPKKSKTFRRTITRHRVNQCFTRVHLVKAV
jgi:hypothetical protein